MAAVTWNGRLGLSTSFNVFVACSLARFGRWCLAFLGQMFSMHFYNNVRKRFLFLLFCMAVMLKRLLQGSCGFGQLTA